MNIQAHDRVGRASAPAGDMIHVHGGTFRMGSDKHYPEEAPAHRATIESFLIDRTPVTNAAFRAFVGATGYVTFAEIVPEAKDYPGALPHMLKAGSMVFIAPSHAVDLRDGRNGGRLRLVRTGAGPMDLAAQSKDSTTILSCT